MPAGSKGPLLCLLFTLTFTTQHFWETIKRPIAQFSAFCQKKSLLDKSDWPGMLGEVKEKSTTKDLPETLRGR